MILHETCLSEDHFLYLLLIKALTCKFITVRIMINKFRIITSIYSTLWLFDSLKHLSSTKPRLKEKKSAFIWKDILNAFVR